ncbi:hypothetical protein Sgly_0318 [Syntrophobotulus glycolicus DSM 8271]|uniref:SAM-dependent methyltransferase n=1 Tax=Syntrophobotulus glycolicus (strain DSM 8271 / FlGlyR) TaxID=645991 RepID=F0SXD8_SYNGF|nr:SAM-dependent DNA methyltransferase [Syntrophobotulus glycolicus]ADY54684.1 hypothetical protein Sgly_0318 [Syntrophobotulus glycolicus DSM 8271]
MNGQTLANKTSKQRPATDFYPTPPEVTIALLRYLRLPESTVIWEPACGKGHMAETMKAVGYHVISSDLNDFGYGMTGMDYLSTEIAWHDMIDWIITNPPFSQSVEFIKQGIHNRKPFALLLKSQYWHSKSRMDLFNQFRPRAVLPLTWRPDFLFGQKSGAPTMECYWTVWDRRPAEKTVYELLEKPK